MIKNSRDSKHQVHNAFKESTLRRQRLERNLNLRAQNRAKNTEERRGGLDRMARDVYIGDQRDWKKCMEKEADEYNIEIEEASSENNLSSKNSSNDVDEDKYLQQLISEIENTESV